MEGERLSKGERERLLNCLRRLAAAGVVARLVRHHRNLARQDGELERWVGRAAGLGADQAAGYRMDQRAWKEEDAALVQRCFAGLSACGPETDNLAAAQAAVLMILGEKPRRRLSNVPLLLVRNSTAGLTGQVARLTLDLWTDGHGQLFPAPPMLRSFGPAWQEAIATAWRRVPFPHNCDVQWEVAAEASQLDGASAQASFQVALTCLLEGYSYDPQCALSAQVDETGRLCPVRGLVDLFQGVGPKLFAAKQAGLRRVLLSRADFRGISAAAREGLRAVGVSLTQAASVEEALSLVHTERTLDQYVRQRRLKPRQAAALVAELARALEAARRRDLLYLNLRPETIVVDDRGRPHFMDLGVARLAPRQATGSRTTEERWDSYQAPEQARGQSDAVTHQADIFALGGVLYYLLVGKAPFTGKSPAEVRERVAQGDFDRLALKAAAPAPLVDIVLRALKPQTSERYETAGNLAEELERFDHSLRRRALLRWSAGAAAAAVPLAGFAAWLAHGNDRPLVVSLGPLFTKDEPADPAFDRIGEERWLRYSETAAGSVLRIAYAMPYLEKYRQGGPVTGVEDALPFAWHYPNLAVRITNHSRRDLVPTRADLRVSESRLDESPLLVVLKETETLWLENEGWGEVIDPVVHFQITPAEEIEAPQEDREPMKASRPIFCPVETRQMWKLRLNKDVPESLAEKENVRVAGFLEYGPADRRQSVRFATLVRLQPAAQHAVPPSFQHHVLLEAGKTQLQSIPLSEHVISPGETELFYLRIGSDRTATYRLSLTVYADGEREIGRQDLELNVFVPRSQAARAVKNMRVKAVKE